MEAESGDRAAGADRQGGEGRRSGLLPRRSAGVISTRKLADLNGENVLRSSDSSGLAVSLACRCVD